ncbi:MAG: DUF2027 domain-containing protein [Bacteroidales bacterium]|nr:DUF2027 domain-containing protein [Bacteroidales bacterium]
MVKVNDIVRFLNDVGGGRVVRVEGPIVYVEDEDGFERPAQAREVVVVGQAGTKASAYERPLSVKSKLVEPDKPAPKVNVAPAVKPQVIETNEGEVLNIVLAFEPKEIKHLNTTTFYATLVNDSNYFLHVAYMTRRDDENTWHTRYAGLVEPNMQMDLDEFGHADLNDIEHVAVQYIAFKQDKGFRLKNPALVEYKLDLTKFYKLHSFHQSEYFDEAVMQIDITRNDLPARQLRIDSSALERAMKEKRHADRPQSRRVEHHGKKQKDDIIVQDLHIAELLDNLSGLSNSDMLNVQLDKFREIMDANKRKIGQKIVFIHGKGEGVLRRALLDELKRKWPQCDVQDASFQEYGFGATQVTIKQPR